MADRDQGPSTTSKDRYVTRTNDDTTAREGREARVLALLFAMTKDRALVALGLSSKMRTKVRELEAARVHGRVAEKRAKLAEVRAALLRRTSQASGSRSCNEIN